MNMRFVKKVLPYMAVATMSATMLMGCSTGDVAKIAEESGITEALDNKTDSTEETVTEDTVDDAASDVAEESTDSEAADSEEVYTDPNGWSVPYNPKFFKVDQQSDKVVFTYTGGKGEPSTITFKYQEGKSGKELADEFSKSYGGAQIEDRDDFMYVENVKSFYIEKEPEDSAKGPFNIAFTRDYKDGGFSMEVLEKHCGDEMDDMNTSDMIGLIMGSIKFDK